MEDEENQDDSLAPLPVLPRLDRLDRLLQLLEEKHQTSDMHSSNPVTEQDDGQCKALASALEEVHHKGTLMERLAMLENRVLQLSLGIYERNTSRSSSSTALVSEISCQDSVVVPKVSNQHEVEIVPRLEKLDPRQIQEEDCGEEGKKFVKPKRRENCTTQKKKSNRKWIGWFGMRCY